MSNKIITLEINLEPSDNRRLASLCGPFDDNIKHLERRLGVEISYRGNFFTIVGKPHTSAAALEITEWPLVYSGNGGVCKTGNHSSS